VTVAAGLLELYILSPTVLEKNLRNYELRLNQFNPALLTTLHVHLLHMLSR